MTYLFSVVVAASLVEAPQRVVTRAATQRRGYITYEAGSFPDIATGLQPFDLLKPVPYFLSR